MAGIEEEMKLLEQGQLFLFLTDYKEAEDLYRDAFKRSHPKKAEYNDLRPLFGLLYGLTSIIKSISCLGRSHIKESLKRLQGAEKILHNQKDWTGRKILKGILLASIGGIEVSQKNIVKGIVTLSKSTKYLKVIQKSGIHYDGIESDIIKSLSLFMLGLLQVTYSFLSDTKGKVAKWLSGFSGNKSLGIENLKKCFNEDGLFAPWAGLAYIFIHTDTNNILGCGEEDNQETFTFCKQIITRCKEKYEQFGILAVAEVNIYLLERSITDAEKVLSHNRPLFQLPGGKLTFFTKCGIVHLCNMKFLEAGSSFKHGMDELMKVGQRGMVPSNSFFAFLCLIQVLKEIKEEEDKTNEAYLTLQVNTERSVSRLLRVFDWCMKKKSYTWGPGDKEFYDWVEDYVDFDPIYQQKDTRLSIRTIMKRIKDDNWILLDILEKVIIELHATSFMSDELLSDYLERIEEEEQNRTKITKIQQMKLLCFKAEILSQMKEYKGALTELNKLDFKKKKQKSSSLENYLFLFSEFIKARIEFDNKRLEVARTIIKKMKKISSDSHRYKQYLSSRKALLLERIDSEYCKTHKKVQVSKRGRVTFSYNLTDNDNINKLRENEHILRWNLVGGCNSCKVEIYHKQQKRKAKKRVLGTISKDTDLRESVEGTLKDIPKNGTLFFKFDNHKNVLHGKTFYFQTQPELNLSNVKQEKQEEDVQVEKSQEQ